MSKRKTSKYGVRSEFLVVLGVVLFIFGVTVLRVSQSALGDYENQNKGNGKSGEHKNGSSDEDSAVITIAPTAVVTAVPTSAPVVQPVTQKVVLPTESVTVAPTAAPNSSAPTRMTNQASQVFLPVMDQPEIQTVPLSGKSVVNLQEGTISVTKTGGGSILDAIKRGIDSIGGGKTTSPTITPIPTPTTRQSEKEKEQQVLPDQMKLKYQIKSGQVSLTAEDKAGKTIVVDDTRLRELESSVLNRLEKKGITLNLTTGNQLAVSDSKVTAITDLPILVDIDSRSLVVSTGGGLMPITLLPDKALKNIIDLGIIANVNTKVVPKIEYSDGEVIYKFEATKVYKVLGRFPVTVPVTISVSAASGDVVSRDQPFITRVVSLISL